ncbi:hypothetical protein HPP92_004034 [Vanilla planifolia]|uniref:Peroxidase n=1 Tax=Vanilla planifolia TaxID=51239 RepID=A0A835VJI5_VANPL|nr:hypothetical protein HPP92_004034 [Vanilla planifolia]
MASTSFLAIIFLLSIISFPASEAQLSSTFYSRTCPNLLPIVRSSMARAVARETRMAASILRLFFHDCFVNGCDGSILLDDTPTFTGEQNALPNRNSVRGWVDRRGRWGWEEQTRQLRARYGEQRPPAPSSSLATLVSKFAAKGLSARDMTALSGGHTIGQAQCQNFRPHIYNDTNINTSFAALRRANCTASGGDTNLAPLDVQSPNAFGNDYYQNLMGFRGLLHSDQELFNNGTQDTLVRQYVRSRALFFSDFAAAMVKLGAISPLTGTNGEIRLNCSKVNS